MFFMATIFKTIRDNLKNLLQRVARIRALDAN